MYHWDFWPVIANADLLFRGLLNTLAVTGTALAFGVPLGLALALSRLSGRRWLAWPAGFVIEVFRTTPPLVQLFWFFFALPLLIHVEMTHFVASALTFSIQSRSEEHTSELQQLIRNPYHVLCLKNKTQKNN